MNRMIALLAITTLTACGSLPTMGEVTLGPESNTSIGIGYDEVQARNAALNAAYDQCRGYEVLNMETNYKGAGTPSSNNPDFEVTIVFSCPESSVQSD